MTAALIIAAGKRDRKEKFSPEKQIGRITAMERIVLLLQLAEIKRIVVVGDEDELPQKLVSSRNLIFLTSPASGEMLDSIKTGLSYLQDKCDRVLISYVDNPTFSAQTISLLLSSQGEVCIPSYLRRCGHPVLLSASSFERILSYQGGGGLKEAIKAAELKRTFVETDDPGILGEKQAKAIKKSLPSDREIAEMRPSLHLRIIREKTFYGPGAHHLLKLTGEFGSLSRACQHMGMSYTKGRKIIATMEEQLGTPVLETQQGGRTGGFSRLTEAATELVSCYDKLQEEANALVQELFQKHFSSFRK